MVLPAERLEKFTIENLKFCASAAFPTCAMFTAELRDAEGLLKSLI
jgi:hypothetical protein